MHPKRRPYLQLVTASNLEAFAPASDSTPDADPISAAAHSLRISATRLTALSATLAAQVDGLNDKLSGLAAIERNFAASHLRAVEIAAEAATLERHIRDTSPADSGESAV